MRQKHVLPMVIVGLGTCLAACGSSDAEPAQGGASGAAGGGLLGANAGPGGNTNRGYGGGAGNRAGAGGASAGSGGLAALGGQSGAGTGGQSLNPACVKPMGNDLPAQDYSLPNGCSFHPGYMAQSSTVTSEVPAPRTWAVETAQVVEIGLSSSPWCGGTAPPSYFTLVLLPLGSKAIVQSLCSGSCNFGAGGFPA